MNSSIAGGPCDEYQMVSSFAAGQAVAPQLTDALLVVGICRKLNIHKSHHVGMVQMRLKIVYVQRMVKLNNSY